MEVIFRREVDELGRITLPTQFRKNEGIEPGDTIAFYKSKDKIFVELFEKYPGPRCGICNKKEKAVKFKGVELCSSCLTEIKSL